MRYAFFLLALSFLLPCKTAHAQDDACFGIINETGSTLRVSSKTGSLTYKHIHPWAFAEFCCPTHPSLCFDKKDGTTKAKFVRLDPDGPDEWSGISCNRIRIRPGQTVSVSSDLDGMHIICKFVDPATYKPPFKRIDSDGDGILHRGEALERHILKENFEIMDGNHDGRVTPDEYNDYWYRTLRDRRAN